MSEKKKFTEVCKPVENPVQDRRIPSPRNVGAARVSDILAKIKLTAPAGAVAKGGTP